jgi:hypothetical protein
VRFHNTGPSSIPGAIVMSIEDGHRGIPSVSQIDPIYSLIVVIFNARPSEFSYPSPALKDRKLELHPVQVNHASQKIEQYHKLSPFSLLCIRKVVRSLSDKLTLSD